VESVEANGDRWHRVYVGPFQSHNTLSDARSKLISESIDTLVIRQKK
ncbi:MAG: SPOR domain-containing protein, partial [Gammaproteobacteria bacterium]|nr:SPOR domain-containing protein [Gammaproteobacteria bacterium]MBU1831198.1 SPOR domain-containing protein [Gammaproteobacteria bacterium]